jgi:hypothetical protein
MNRPSCIKTGLLLILVVTHIGCKSKQEAPGSNAAVQSQNAGSMKNISGGKSAAVPAIPPKDMADARAAAIRVLDLLDKGDYSTIYKEASDGFKQIGPEAAFAAQFQRSRQKIGGFKKPQETNFAMRPDKIYVLVYSVVNKHFKTEVRLSFSRSKSGKMELAGLNQHDEPIQ